MSAALRDLYPELAAALKAEIEAARSEGGDRYSLHDGVAVRALSVGYLYQFRLDRDCRVPDESRIAVTSGGSEIDGVVVAVDGLQITLQTQEPISNLRRAAMLVRLWFILDKLRARLEEVAHGQDGPAFGLFDCAGPSAQTHPIGIMPIDPAIRASLNREQCRAVSLAQQP